MDTPLGMADARPATPAPRLSRPVGRSRRVAAALPLAGVALCALSLVTGPHDTASAQSQPPTIPPLPGTTYQPLPATATPVRTLVVLPTPTPRAPLVPAPAPAPGLRPAPGASPGVVVPGRAPAQVPAQAPSGPSVPARAPALPPAPAQQPVGTVKGPAEIPPVGYAAPSTAPALFAGLGTLLVAAGLALRRRGR